jgi:hypothetical protein
MPTQVMKFTNKLYLYGRVDNLVTICYKQKRGISVCETYENISIALEFAKTFQSLSAPYEQLLSNLHKQKKYLTEIGAYRQIKDNIEEELLNLANNVFKGIK